jgi:hypothetical protein
VFHLHCNSPLEAGSSLGGQVTKCRCQMDCVTAIEADFFKNKNFFYRFELDRSIFVIPSETFARGFGSRVLPRTTGLSQLEIVTRYTHHHFTILSVCVWISGCMCYSLLLLLLWPVAIQKYILKQIFQTFYRISWMGIGPSYGTHYSQNPTSFISNLNDLYFSNIS